MEQQDQILESLFSRDPSAFAGLTADQLSQLSLLVELVDAISGASADQTDEEEAQELRYASALMHFQEISSRYARLLDRVATLDPLPFDDPQLEEATRCWLYGFNRATVVLAGTALEAAVRNATGGEGTLGPLVDLAVRKDLLAHTTGEVARLLVRYRNKCVHEGYAPDDSIAAECLAYARKAIGEIRSKELG